VKPSSKYEAKVRSLHQNTKSGVKPSFLEENKIKKVAKPSSKSETKGEDFVLKNNNNN
jgi:hypothetical protein